MTRGKGIDDHLALVGPEIVLDEIAHVDFAGSAWRKDLLRSKPPMNNAEGRILPVLANAIAAFRHAPEWGGVLAFNEFGFGTVALKPAPWGIVAKGEWTDHEDRLAAEWLQKQGILVSVEVAGQAVQTAARDRPFHPVKTYLQGLHWDGLKRVDRVKHLLRDNRLNGCTYALGFWPRPLEERGRCRAPLERICFGSTLLVFADDTPKWASARPPSGVSGIPTA